MGIIPSLFPWFLAGSVVAGFYAPISLSSSAPNDISLTTTEQLVAQTTGSQVNTAKQTRSSKYSRKLNVKGPIFTCNQHERNYEIYLALEKGEDEQSWNQKSLKNLVTFRVVDVKDGKTIVWGPGAQKENQWTNWRLRFEDEKVQLSVPSDGKFYKNSDHISITCQIKKINKVLNGVGRELTVAAVKEDGITNTSVLKAEVNTKRCAYRMVVGKGKEKECEINLDSGTNLKWAKNFSPKVIFPISGK